MSRDIRHPHGVGDAALHALFDLHAETDARFAATTAAIGTPIGCRPGCAACCQDDLRVWQVEADAIEQWAQTEQAAGRLLLRVHARGACAFLDDDGRCQVFAARPYVCRSQGAVLAWSEDDEQGLQIERRATCEVHLQGVDLMTLPAQATFELGPAESRLVSIAVERLSLSGGKGLPKRVALRALATRLSLATGGR